MMRYNMKYLKHSLPKCPPSHKNNRINDDLFEILKYNEYNRIVNNNYSIKQLKTLCKHYSLPSSGNKMSLSTLLYNYLKLINNVTTIQKYYRGYIERKLIKLKGPGLFNRELCNNSNDFFTLEKIVNIPYSQFYSYKDSKDYIYGFNILSIYKLLTKHNINICNPYNRDKLPDDILAQIKQIINLSKINKYEIIIEDTLHVDIIKEFKLRILSLFQNINSLGNYSKSEWFTDLSKDKLVIFIRELYDIWNYRAQLLPDTKRLIVPPHGNPFMNINVHYLRDLPFNQLQRKITYIMEKFVNSTEVTCNRNLGACYILSALTLVNNEAAESLPWLYQSVKHY